MRIADDCLFIPTLTDILYNIFPSAAENLMGYKTIALHNILWYNMDTNKVFSIAAAAGNNG